MPDSSNEDREQQPALEHQEHQREPALRGRQEAARPRRNWDGYAAVIATFIGLLALMVSGYTAYVQRQQLRAQVWPYVIVSTSNVPPVIGLHVVNGGTGPARVIAARVTVDKQPVASWALAQKAMGPDVGGVVTSQLTGSVIPADKDVTIIRPYDEQTSPRFLRLFLGEEHDVVVTICYCSVLDECWVAASGAIPDRIADPDACPISPAERFKS